MAKRKQASAIERALPKATRSGFASAIRCLYVVSGTLNIHVPEAEGQVWFELNPRDGFYIPAGTDRQYFNMSGDSEFVFGVAPEF
ncbi:MULTISPECIES: cupin domain-containing protein [Ensifer]|uniref:cupin domain-containing protein n=1 Tax=Ensifer TaxID=106591 RepID=UPI0008072ECF|nr:cupin domain-containing protein [Ensifer adhaerens]